jgi:hypothetical protein
MHGTGTPLQPQNTRIVFFYLATRFISAPPSQALQKLCYFPFDIGMVLGLAPANVQQTTADH